MKVKLGEIFEIGSGGTPSKAHPEYYGGNIPWVKTGDLKSEYLYEVEDFITEEGLKHSAAKMYESDTVLIAMYGATIGATSILKLNACTNQACAAFKKNDLVIQINLSKHKLSIKPFLKHYKIPFYDTSSAFNRPHNYGYWMIDHPFHINHNGNKGISEFIYKQKIEK